MGLIWGLGFGLVAGVVLIFVAFDSAQERPAVALFIAGLLLGGALYALEILLGVGFSYGPVQIHLQDAPIAAAIGALLLVAAVGGVVALIVSLTLLRKIWVHAPSARPFVPTVFLPCVVLLLSQHYEAAAKSTDPLQRVYDSSGREAARRDNIRTRRGCKKLDSTLIGGCLRHVQGYSLQSAADAAVDGGFWAKRHEIVSVKGCQSSSFIDFDDNRNFVAGCKAEVLKVQQNNGALWAGWHNIVNEDACRSGGKELVYSPVFVDEPVFVAACRSAVAEARRREGGGWAQSRYIFAPADCTSDLPGVKHNREFKEGCESAVQAARVPETARARGKWWGRMEGINRVADCHGAVPNAPPEFEAACEEELRSLHREVGQHWAQTHDIKKEAACEANDKGPLQPIVDSDFIAACRQQAIDNRKRKGK